MRYRTIAGTDIEVSELGFGVWTVSAGWWGDYSDDDAVRLLRAAYDRGVTFFDTADTYGNGRGETLLAQAFPGAERDGIVIGTKFGYDWQSNVGKRREGHQEAEHSFEPDFLERALEGSLRRLGTDRIDNWQLHNVRMEHLQLDHVWTFVDKARQAGKVRSVGVALGPAIGWLDEGLYAMRELPVEVIHMIYNALEIEPGRELIRVARETNRSIFVRVPHSSGMLEGKYTKDTVFDENDHRSHRPRSWLLDGLEKVERLGFLTEGGDRTIGQAALRYVLHSPQVVSVMPNIYGMEQIEEFAAASDCPDLSDEEAARVERLFDPGYGVARPGETEKVTVR